MTKLLYIDHVQQTCSLMKRWFEDIREIAECNTSRTIDGAINLFRKNQYDAITFHLDMYCSDELRREYKQQAEWSGLFKDNLGRFDVDLVPGGAIFLTYLHTNAYPGIRILTSGIGQDFKEIQRLTETNLIHGYLRRLSTQKDLENMLRDNGVFDKCQ